MSEYAGTIGFIQKFGDKPAIETKEVAQRTIRTFVIRAMTPEQSLINVTVWPDHAAVSINEGDLVAVEGKYTSRVVDKQDGSRVTYFDISASALVVIAQAPKAAREVVNQTQTNQTSAAGSTSAPAAEKAMF